MMLGAYSTVGDETRRVLVPCMFYHCLENLGGVGVVVESCREMFCLFILLNALPVAMLRQVSQNSRFTCMGAYFW